MILGTSFHPLTLDLECHHCEFIGRVESTLCPERYEPDARTGAPWREICCPFCGNESSGTLMYEIMPRERLLAEVWGA